MSNFFKLATLPIYFVASIMLLPKSTLANPSWVLMGYSGTGTRIYVETSTLRRQGSTAWYWTHYYSSGNDENGIASTKTYQSANCRLGQYRVRTIISFDEQGRVLGNINDGNFGELVQASPGSAGEAVMKYACSAR